MDRITINTGTKADGFVQLGINDMVEKNNELVFTLSGSDKFCYNIYEGDEIVFKRVISCENNPDRYIFDKVTVIKEDENHVIHATLPMNRKTYLNKEKKYDEIKINNITYLIVYCEDDHYFFAQDLDFYSTNLQNYIQQEIYFENQHESVEKEDYEIRPMRVIEKDVPTIDDCIISEELFPSCNKNFEYYTKYGYIFSPENISKKMFLIKIKNNNHKNYIISSIENSKYFETKYNPFYYYTILVSDNIRDNPATEAIELDDYGNPVRHCYFYYDKWFDSLTNDPSNGIEYFNLGNYTNGAFFNMAYYFSNITFYSDSDESTLGSDEHFNVDFLEQTEESLIPEIIDMERVKYAPYYLSGETYYPIDEIIIHPHFRERVLVDPENNTNTLSTSGNLYSDGWFIDTNNSPNVFWNGYTGSSSYTEIADFITESGEMSDLIGFLNFTDNDIYYSKNKVSKSFFRFLFYDSKDIIEQNLLYYSTIFLDSTELLSKFLKQRMFVFESDEEDIIINDIAISGDTVNENVKIVFCENTEVGCRLDTTLDITNEYNTERCAEGYNLYLFSDDAPLEDEEKTIYLKIEFNHAGNGKVIPMIMMPTNENLTTNNFFDNLFIELKLKKMGCNFAYIFNKGNYYSEDGTLHLCLLEPKLEEKQITTEQNG